MIKPGVDTYIDDRQSCTKDEAVAKLIGWMRGKIRRNVMYLDEFGAYLPEQLPYLHTLEGTVLDVLHDQHSAALAALRFAEESGAAERTIDSLRKAVADYGKQRVDAERYSEELDVEIARVSSELELDYAAMDEKGGIHITLDSLEKWASKKSIAISVLSDIEFNELPPAEEQGQLSRRGLVEKGWLTPTLADHLHVTLALMTVALSNQRSVFHTSDGEVNVNAIATELEAIAKYANNDKCMDNQRARSITDRLTYALRKLQANLPGRLRKI